MIVKSIAIEHSYNNTDNKRTDTQRSQKGNFHKMKSNACEKRHKDESIEQLYILIFAKILDDRKHIAPLAEK